LTNVAQLMFSQPGQRAGNGALPRGAAARFYPAHIGLPPRVQPAAGVYQQPGRKLSARRNAGVAQVGERLHGASFLFWSLVRIIAQCELENRSFLPVLVSYTYQMSRLPLATLPAFRTVAELQNLRAAAEVLHLTHSAVSQQIRNLEEQLGFDLFERRGRRVLRNAAGEALLRGVQSALAQLDDGVQAAAAAASGAAPRLRVTLLPSFAQRWLLPRMGRWRAQYPDLALELEASHLLVDLVKDGFHAAIRQGRGPWPGLQSEQLFEEPVQLIVLGSAQAARRLAGASPAQIAREPLLGDDDVWQAWFKATKIEAKTNPVAVFSDAGLMLTAAEQNLGLCIAREVLAADAIRAGKLVQLSPIAFSMADAHPYHLVYPPALRDWPPLNALRQWLKDELAASCMALHPPSKPAAKRKSRAKN
jgi:LysR family transcriptional regulator, glycine cleavage system transcriptional activator